MDPWETRRARAKRLETDGNRRFEAEIARAEAKARKRQQLRLPESKRAGGPKDSAAADFRWVKSHP